MCTGDGGARGQAPRTSRGATGGGQEDINSNKTPEGLKGREGEGASGGDGIGLGGDRIDRNEREGLISDRKDREDPRSVQRGSGMDRRRAAGSTVSYATGTVTQPLTEGGVVVGGVSEGDGIGSENGSGDRIGDGTSVSENGSEERIGDDARVQREGDRRMEERRRGGVNLDSGEGGSGLGDHLDSSGGQQGEGEAL